MNRLPAIPKDFKYKGIVPISRAMKPRYFRWSALTLVVGLFGIAFTTESHHALAPPDEAESGVMIATQAAREVRRTIPLPPPDAEQAAGVRPAVAATVDLPPEVPWHSTQVKPGDSLAKIFSRWDLNPRELHDIMALGNDVSDLKRLRPGETLKVQTTGSGEIQTLVYERNRIESLYIQRVDDGFAAERVERPVEHRVSYASNDIKSSLSLSAQQVGLSEGLAMELANIFGWDIDFALDIRQGDRFTIVYEELYLDGEKVGDGAILAAEFINRDRAYRALRYTDAQGRSGYYTPEGLNVRKAFLRTPVEFSRISSRFNLNRRHPVLNKIRAHRGVDYAAPTGTPVRATGDGKIIEIGTNNGFGRVIVIQHGSQYNTLYAHLSRFASGLRVGSRVRQGQVIGYVGSTGLATGPHLHYEFRVNGVHRNPLTIRLPAAEPIPESAREDFSAQTQPLLAQLELLSAVRLAQN